MYHNLHKKNYIFLEVSVMCYPIITGNSVASAYSEA